MRRTKSIHRRGHHKRGLTLAELVVSSVSTMVLIAGLSSAIFVASQAADSSMPANKNVNAALTLEEMAADLRMIKSFVSKSAKAVQFTVDDRSTDADAVDETIRYHWDSAGGPLYRTYNGQLTAILPDIYSLDLTYNTQEEPTNKRILFLQGNVSGTESTYDDVRVQRMQGWGYTVLRKTVTAATTQSELELATVSMDAIYVSTSVVVADLGAKLKSTTKGVILEDIRAAAGFQIATQGFASNTEDDIKLTDNTHYITAPFATGNLRIAITTVPLLSVDPNGACDGLVMYAKPKSGSFLALGVVKTGGTLLDSSQSAGRRVLVTWGGDGINPSNLNSTCDVLWQRSLVWASGAAATTSIEIKLQLAVPDKAPGKKSAGVLPGAEFQLRTGLVGRPRD